MSDFILDIQGVLFRGDEVISGAKELVDKIISLNKKVILLSNSTRLATKKVLAQLNAADINVPEENVITGPKIIIHALKAASIKHIILFGTNEVSEELEAAGITVDKSTALPNNHAELYPLSDDVKAIVVAEDLAFNFAHASICARYILEKKTKFICTGYDRVFPWKKDEYIPGALTLSTPAETASYVSPEIIGKPNVETFADLIPEHKTKQYVVVGDNTETDIAFANKLGYKSVLVYTGITNKNEEIKEGNKPTYTFETLAELTAKVAEI